MLSPASNTILSFIGAMESRNNYKSCFGHGDMDFSVLTCGQVLSFQGARIEAGAKSTALGRYQFIQSTLKACLKATKTALSAKFTNDVQDLCAEHLLKERGLEDFLAGHLAADDFAMHLAQEWASVPCVKGPHAGRSYYAGDGLNKSLTTPKKLMATLAQAKTQAHSTALHAL